MPNTTVILKETGKQNFKRAVEHFFNIPMYSSELIAHGDRKNGYQTYHFSFKIVPHNFEHHYAKRHYGEFYLVRISNPFEY